MTRWQGSGSGRGEDLDAIEEAAFGPLPGDAGNSAADGRAMSLAEAEDVLVDAAFAGHGHSVQRLHEAERVLERGAVEEAAMPASPAGTQRVAAVNDVLSRVVTSPDGRTAGFSEAQDRRIDAAYTELWGLAESRLGMPHAEAVDHARRVFLECQHVAAQAKETKNDFIGRLEQRVAGYRAMSPLVIESRPR